MFNVGGGELIVIMVLALIVLGPKRLPDAARQIGKVMADLRRLSSGFQNEIRSALDDADDPNRVAARRNVLAKEEPAAKSGDDRPVRTEPLVAGPGLEPRPNGTSVEASTDPSEGRPLTAQARAAAKRSGTADKATAKSAPADKATAKNGTSVKKKAAASAAKAKPATAKAASKAAPRRTKT